MTGHILVVDDEVDTCRNLRDILNDYGYEVDIAHDGPRAIELVRANAYDLALLDLRMPGMDGISVLREGFVPVRVDEHRDQLLAIKRGDVPWEETEKWRLALHTEFDNALTSTKLPDRPDYEQANDFLVKARKAAIEENLP